MVRTERSEVPSSLESGLRESVSSGGVKEIQELQQAPRALHLLDSWTVFYDHGTTSKS